MTNQHIDAPASDEHPHLPLRDLADLSGLSEAEVLELVDYGALSPAGAAVGQWSFSVRSITVARTARRLREDFGFAGTPVEVSVKVRDKTKKS